MTKQTASTVRSFANRRSATDLLRKLGVPPLRYADLITEKSGKFVVDVSKVGPPMHPAEPIEEAKPVTTEKPKRVIASAKKQPAKTAKPTSKPTSKPAAKTAKPTKRKDGRPSVAARCLELFQAGKSNKDTWALIRAEYGLDEDKAHYPAWYRSHYRRKGVLPRPAEA